MHIFLALLYLSVVTHESSSLPVKEESIRNTMDSIINIARTTLVHIRKVKTKVRTVPSFTVESG